MKIVATFIAALIATSAYSALPNGAAAPDFTMQVSLGGKVSSFTLSEALKKGPVVLYFYPAAFTKGCTIEAHDFAEAIDRYHALGATVIGVSHDDIATLNRFSVSECRSKFPVGSDADQKIMKSYDAVLAAKPELASRTSYVITPDGKILYSFTDLDPGQHVANTLKALADWKAKQ
ncbi:peroxiredoxin [Jeongeupia chitinilytica]|uniref:thioredoxin-dependent peroxiredoxin n=1 Tax=Jeongeupia chitinilytica TaxID=1041641 RepID=A0ABQ3GZ93_9NEIS|nr:peroxiredoxin [Jeongeupia chitinilytica]GHD60841.1 peroxiredoxin [Jeongeupia chitinilytica]